MFNEPVLSLGRLLVSLFFMILPLIEILRLAGQSQYADNAYVRGADLGRHVVRHLIENIANDQTNDEDGPENGVEFTGVYRAVHVMPAAEFFLGAVDGKKGRVYGGDG